jgi:hypothetical protein
MQGWLATPTRRNALKGIFIAPAILMLGVAVQSRPNYIDFDRLITDVTADQKISQYVPVVRATDTLLSQSRRTPEDLERVARLWTEGADTGKLKPLRAQTYEDSIHLGVKGQILSCAKALAHELDKSSKTARAEGNYAASAEYLVTAMRLMQPLRYSDLTSIAVVGGAQRRYLKELALVWPQLDDTKRSSLAGQIEEIKPDPAEIEEAIHQERRLAVVERSRLKEVAQATGKQKPDSTPDEDLPIIIRVCRNTEGQLGHLVAQLQVK